MRRFQSIPTSIRCAEMHSLHSLNSHQPYHSALNSTTAAFTCPAGAGRSWPHQHGDRPWAPLGVAGHHGDGENQALGGALVVCSCVSSHVGGPDGIEAPAVVQLPGGVGATSGDAGVRSGGVLFVALVIFVVLTLLAVLSLLGVCIHNVCGGRGGCGVQQQEGRAAQQQPSGDEACDCGTDSAQGTGQAGLLMCILLKTYQKF